MERRLALSDIPSISIFSSRRIVLSVNTKTLTVRNFWWCHVKIISEYRAFLKFSLYLNEEDEQIKNVLLSDKMKPLSLNWVYTELMETLILWTQTKTINLADYRPRPGLQSAEHGETLCCEAGLDPPEGPTGNLYIHTFTSLAPGGFTHLHNGLLEYRKWQKYYKL